MKTRSTCQCAPAKKNAICNNPNCTCTDCNCGDNCACGAGN
ncbi:hypothetical protein [Flavobacterium sp.]|nr:hypothetical protein [Flavobacterium sp.]